jgi:PPOX class probable F420-dependent enzyme
MPVDLADLSRFIGLDHGLAVVSVVRPDGSVASSLVNAGVLDHPVDGRPVIGFVAAGGARKLDHLRRDPRATLVWRAGWRWLGASGAAELAGPDDAWAGLDPASGPALLRAVFVGAGGTHEDWDEFDQVMADERRTAVLVHPDRLFGNPAV